MSINLTVQTSNPHPQSPALKVARFVEFGECGKLVKNVFEASAVDGGTEAEELIRFYYGDQEVSLNLGSAFSATHPWDEVFRELKKLNAPFETEHETEEELGKRINAAMEKGEGLIGGLEEIRGVKRCKAEENDFYVLSLCPISGLCLSKIRVVEDRAFFLYGSDCSCGMCEEENSAEEVQAAFDKIKS